ncbi:class I histocompatibility antigen, F10 alpha chain-like [Rhinoderma darwinii]|uniref:class I histocompatibility antigen, F10 alpha chain-like n=1 Tax=Rhinoderma darwinii TaxID=43563 RepID=UPI003F663DC5
MSPFILLVLCVSATVYADSHSLRYYYTGVSAGGSGLPEFSIVGYVDDQQIDLYSSDTKKNIPVASWMKKKDSEYWKRETDTAKSTELLFRHDVKVAMNRFNQTGGSHFYQVRYGCERSDDGSITGYEQHGYDGREFLSLDTQTWTFTATMPQALITTEKINSPEVEAGQMSRRYLQHECIKALEEYVEYGREDLERRVQPKVKVSSQEDDETMKLHCQVYGFHPRAVDVKWRKNGMDDIPTYETTHILPNPDGTYQTRVTAEVIPKEGDRYSCYVAHSSLAESLNVMLEPEKASDWAIPVIIAVAVVILLAGGIGGFLLYKRKKDGYKATSSEYSAYSCTVLPITPSLTQHVTVYEGRLRLYRRGGCDCI